MPPAFDPTAAKTITLKAIGGEIGAASTLAPKVGPLGLSPKKIGEDIQKASLAWKGLRVTIQLTIINRQATVEVKPAASTMLIRALNEPPRDRKKGAKTAVKHDGNVTLEHVIDVARQLRAKSLSRTLQGTVLEVLGTAYSVGCTVNGQPPKAIQGLIKSGDITIPEK